MDYDVILKHYSPTPPSNVNTNENSRSNSSIPSRRCSIPSVIDSRVTEALRPHYEVRSQISSGGHGCVFFAVDQDNQEYAIKIQKYDLAHPMLKHEMTIMEQLCFDPRTGAMLSSVGIPTLKNYLILRGHEYLVMERLGDSLQNKMYEQPTRMLSKKTVLMVGIQVIQRLQFLHGKNVLHRDIKPGNLVMGLGADAQIVHIIDFGLSMIVEDWAKHNPDEDETFHGTYDFAPAEALLGKKPTRAGDLQSLVYSMIFMASGNLDWKYYDGHGNKLSRDEHGKERLNKSTTELCEGFQELKKFANLVFSIKRTDEPNYDMLMTELGFVMESMGLKYDDHFHWFVEEDRNNNEQMDLLDEEVEHEDLMELCPPPVFLAPDAYAEFFLPPMAPYIPDYNGNTMTGGTDTEIRGETFQHPFFEDQFGTQYETLHDTSQYFGELYRIQ